MLTETATFGRDESLSTCTFSISTRESTDEMLYKREYVFSYAKEWDEWTFQQCNVYEDTKTYPRDFEQTKRVFWNSPEGVGFRVPPIVLKQAADVIGEEEVEKMR